MSRPATPFRPVFRDLERALLRRAVARVEPILWVEILALAALASAFLFWQAHIRLASIAHDRGEAAALTYVAAMLAFLVTLGATQVGARHFVRLRSPGDCPPWLALPVPEFALARHLASVSRIQSWWLAAPAAGFLVAAAGVVHWAWLPLLAVGFVAGLDLTGRAACALALRLAALASARRDLSPLTRVLAREVRVARPRALAGARWGRARGWLALFWNDVRLARRVPAARRRAAIAALAIALSCLAWRLPIEPRGVLLIAFALGLFAAATVAEWLIATIGADPPDVVRALPFGVGAAWGTRALWGALATSVLAGGHALAARGVPDGAVHFFVFSLTLASLAITTLGANYGISLYPRAAVAQRVLALSLGLAMAASLMVPLMGWIVLLTALLHSSRRVARWARAEER